ncbi:hypothetical protein B0H14DRAFT_3431950 [Mycena olivaceomarginata]|nr:hypothetical protein B0H14DRAFT_3431950 [Mycena olivaceomarginata]
MPPKGTSKLRDEDFRFNEDRTEVQCRVCNDHIASELRRWILVKNGASHLTKPPHLQAVRLAKEREMRVIRLEGERGAASATDRLREIQFVAPSFPGPVGATSSAQVSDAERKMWDNYRMNGAEFSAGDNVEKPEMEEQRLRKEAEIFGLWKAPGNSTKGLSEKVAF